jgi:oligosaccharide repeat unit polymerase
VKARAGASKGGVPVLTGRILFGVATLVLFGASVFWSALGQPWGPGLSLGIALAAFALHVLLAFRRLSPFDPLVWIPVGFLLFYFGMPFVIEFMGMPTKLGYDPWGDGIDDPFVARGFCAAAFALVAFIWGVYLAGIRPARRIDPTLAQDRSLGVPALLFTLGSLIMVGIGIAVVGPSVVFGTYSDWWDAKLLGADQRWIDIGMVFAQSGVYALFAADEPRVRWRRWFAYLAFVSLAVIAVQKGDRTGLIQLGIGAGWCYSQRIRTMSWPPVLAVAFVALLAFPVLSEWRHERSLDQSTRSTIRELTADSIYNMGGSVSAIYYTIEWMPARKDYQLGSSLWYAVITAIPNPGLSKGVGWRQSDFDSSPSSWITAILAPAWFATGGGYGYAMAAEWYYNFGWPGMLIGMAGFGYLMARTRNRSNRSTMALLWSATLFAGLAMWIRNVAGFPLKVAVWPIVGIWVVDRLVRLLRGRALRPRAIAPVAPERY